MPHPLTRRNVCHVLKEIAPAMAVLFAVIFFSHSSGNFLVIRGWEVIYRVLFRFFRLTVLLCFPLYFLLPISSFLVCKLRKKLLQTKKIEELRIIPMKHWISRPFQGIGLGLLFETKLLAALQVITGVTAEPLLLFHRNQFQFGRMLVVSGITVIISLLLSTLWTLDDTGIRYVSQKNQEIKMIGKYAGTLMPILFGLYGIFSLIGAFPTGQILGYLLKTILILYSPFTFFTILHTHCLRRKADYFSQRASLRIGGVWYDE
jgi:hypothetical protein